MCYEYTIWCNTYVFGSSSRESHASAFVLYSYQKIHTDSSGRNAGNNNPLPGDSNSNHNAILSNSQALIALLFIVVGDISELIEFASFIMWVFYGSGIVCLLVLRKTMKDVPRPYKVPIIIPIFTLIVTIFLSLTPVIVEPSIKYLAAMVFIVVGVMVYVPFVYHKIRPKCMGMLSKHLN